MRAISLLIATTILASCTYGPPPPAMAGPAPGSEHVAAMLAGKVPGPPMSCLPSYNAKNDMSIVDGQTVAFHVGMGTTYVVHLSPGCEQIASGGPYALVSRQYGGSGLCDGDIQQVVDTASHMNVGSCTVAEVVPFMRRPA